MNVDDKADIGTDPFSRACKGFLDTQKTPEMSSIYDVYKKCSLFQNCSLDFIAMLLEEAGTRSRHGTIVAAGEHIIVEGEAGEADLHILVRGLCDVSIRGKGVVHRLKSGDFVGEVFFLGISNRRTATVTTTTLCLFLQIGSKAFFRVLNRFPRERHIIEAISVDRYRKFVFSNEPMFVHKRRKTATLFDVHGNLRQSEADRCPENRNLTRNATKNIADSLSGPKNGQRATKLANHPGENLTPGRLPATSLRAIAERSGNEAVQDADLNTSALIDSIWRDRAKGYRRSKIPAEDPVDFQRLPPTEFLSLSQKHTLLKCAKKSRPRLAIRHGFSQHANSRVTCGTQLSSVGIQLSSVGTRLSSIMPAIRES